MKRVFVRDDHEGVLEKFPDAIATEARHGKLRGAR
jgi:hypothetical protein